MTTPQKRKLYKKWDEERARKRKVGKMSQILPRVDLLRVIKEMAS